MSPRWFFGIPGVILLVCGVIVSSVLLSGPISVMSITFDYHTLMYSTSAIVLGYQSILLFIFAKWMAVESGVHPPRFKFRFFEQRRTLEWCIVIGITLAIVGVLFGIVAARQWSLVRFGSLRPVLTIRFVICSVLFLLLGGQTLMAGFYFGLMNLVTERKARRASSLREAAGSKPIRDWNEGAR